MSSEQVIKSNNLDQVAEDLHLVTNKIYRWIFLRNQDNNLNVGNVSELYNRLNELRDIENTLRVCEIERNTNAIKQKRVYAYFHPQVRTYRDNVISTDYCIPFDITDKLLKIGEAKARKLKDNSYDADALVPMDIVTKHREQYGTRACFVVTDVEYAVDELFGKKSKV